VLNEAKSMITPAYARTMARYNRWQNESLYREAVKLSDEERQRDRGAFFGSIHGTLNHLFWGDSLWLSRFGGGEKPRTASVKDSVGEFEDFADLAVARPALDARIIAWAEALTAETIAGDITWWSGINKANVSRPAALIFTHFFNHQTHHRGQAHALLTIAGTKPDDTDLIYMPGVAG
jgi:uncharacterized damage-inducible protein DinB